MGVWNSSTSIILWKQFEEFSISIRSLYSFNGWIISKKKQNKFINLVMKLFKKKFNKDNSFKYDFSHY